MRMELDSAVTSSVLWASHTTGLIPCKNEEKERVMNEGLWSELKLVLLLQNKTHIIQLLCTAAEMPQKSLELSINLTTNTWLKKLHRTTAVCLKNQDGRPHTPDWSSLSLWILLFYNSSANTSLSASWRSSAAAGLKSLRKKSIRTSRPMVQYECQCTAFAWVWIHKDNGSNCQYPSM